MRVSIQCRSIQIGGICKMNQPMPSSRRKQAALMAVQMCVFFNSFKGFFCYPSEREISVYFTK